jgi:drug/metabolite transporter (DMT)-like permease
LIQYDINCSEEGIMKTNNTNVARGYPVALLAAVFLSTTAIFIRYLTHDYHLPALILAFWRDLVGTLVMIAVLGVVKPGLLRVKAADLRYLAVHGLVLAIFNSAWTLSVALNGAAAATVLVYCSAGFTALLGWWLLNEGLSWGKIAAVVLSLGGCVLVSGAMDPSVWYANFGAILTGIFSGLMYAIYSMFGRSASQRGLNPWTTLVYTFGFAAAFLLGVNLFAGGQLPGTAASPDQMLWLGNSWSGWGILVALAVGPTLLGFGLYNVSLSYLASSVANLIVSLEPAFTALMAYFLLGEQLTGPQFLGGALILGGVLVLRVSEGFLLGQRGEKSKPAAV